MADAPRRFTLSQLKKPVFVPVPPSVDFTFTSRGEGSDVMYSMTGLDSLVKNLSLLPVVYQDAAGVEMTAILEDILQDSHDNFVPYRFGDLRDSADHDEYEEGKGIEIVELSIWYGGPILSGEGAAGTSTGVSLRHAQAGEAGLHTVDPSVYALIQHEDLSFHHPIEGPVSAPQAKYLETPFLAMSPNVLPRIVDAVNAVSGGSPVLSPEGETLGGL